MLTVEEQLILIQKIKNVGEFRLPIEGLELMLNVINSNPNDCFQQLKTIATKRLNNFHFYNLFKERNKYVNGFYKALVNDDKETAIINLESIIMDYIKDPEHLKYIGKKVDNGTKALLFYNSIQALEPLDIAKLKKRSLDSITDQNMPTFKAVLFMNNLPYTHQCNGRDILGDFIKNLEKMNLLNEENVDIGFVNFLELKNREKTMLIEAFINSYQIPSEYHVNLKAVFRKLVTTDWLRAKDIIFILHPYVEKGMKLRYGQNITLEDFIYNNFYYRQAPVPRQFFENQFSELIKAKLDSMSLTLDAPNLEEIEFTLEDGFIENNIKITPVKSARNRMMPG